MSEQEIPNWVERRWRGEKILAESKLGLWREICDALDASAKSFNNRYKGTSEVTRIDGHLVRIVLPTPNRVQIDIAFNDLACSVAAALSYDTPKLHFRNFKIAADHVSAFIADEHGDKLTPVQVSERILSPSFFAQG